MFNDVCKLLLSGFRTTEHCQTSLTCLFDYHQSSSNILAMSLVCTRENVTAALEADYAGYSVRPKMMVFISSALFLMALTFFYFSALRTRLMSISINQVRRL